MHASRRCEKCWRCDGSCDFRVGLQISAIMSALRHRIMAGMGANAAGQAISIGIQLLSLPLFLRYWDLATYGTWLMLSAVPSYFSMADVGMVTAAGNKMTMALGRGDVAAANRSFQSALVFMLLTCGSLALISMPTVLILPVPGLHGVDQRLALCALIGSVLLTFFGGLSEAIFKATGRYALGTTLANLLRLGEWCGWIAGLIVLHSFAGVAISGFVVRAIGVLFLIVQSARGSQGLQWRFNAARWNEVRAMTKPAVSFMAFPLSNALSFQGMTLLTGSVFGAGAVAVFNTYRTLARVAVQAISIFSHAFWAEFSLHFGKGGAGAVASMYRRAALLGTSLACVLSLVLYLVGPFLLRLWTHGNVGFEPSLMLLMLAYAAVGGAWHVPRVFLLSTNEHSALATWSLIFSAASIVLAMLFYPVWHLEGVVAAMLVSELAIATVCVLLVRRIFIAPELALTGETA